jgi:hypothetical protein
MGLKMERFGEVQRCLVDGKTASCRPQLKRIAVNIACGLAAAKDLLLQVHAETTAGFATRRVEGAGTVTLRAPSAEAVEISQMPQDLLQSDLLSQVGIVDRTGSCRVLDHGIGIFYVASGCGDHFALRACPLVARGRYCFWHVRLIDRRDRGRGLDVPVLRGIEAPSL